MVGQSGLRVKVKRELDNGRFTVCSGCMRPTLRFHDGYPDKSPHMLADVRALQDKLKSWGFPISSDGKFGQSTLAAVTAFQRRHNLLDDGIVGRRTWEILERAAPVDIGSGMAPKPAPPEVHPSQAIDDFAARIPGSKYFTWHEALYLPSWKRHATSSEVTATILSNIARQAQALDRVRDHFGAGIVVHCWLRPPAYNTAVKGATKSAHLEGLATDFHVPGFTAEQVRQSLRANPTIYPGAGENKVSWVHLDLKHTSWFNP